MIEVVDEKPELVLEGSDIDEHLWPSQNLALTTPATEILFGGAKGGGKSMLMRLASILFACDAPGIQVYLFRRLFPDLKANHMEGPKSYPNMLARLVQKKHCQIVKNEIRWWNGARIFLNHLQAEKHVTKYQGPEIHFAMFDELTQFSETSYRYIRGSVRLGSWKPPTKYMGFFPRILCGANPGGLGHSWVKRTFIDHGANNIVNCRTLPMFEGQSEGSALRVFIPARAEDNPDLIKYDPGYLERLEGMGNPELVRAMREGDWNVVAGAMFGTTWRTYRHVMDRGFAIPATWEIWRGGDDGYTAPSAVHWITQDPHDFTFYVIRELHLKRQTPEMLAGRILAIDRSIPIDLGTGEIVLNDIGIDGEYDSAAFADQGASQEGSRAAQMNKLGTNWKPVRKGPGSRAMRAQMMHTVLATNPRSRFVDKFGEKMPGIRFFPECVSAIETIPQLPIDPNNSECVDSSADDHDFDSITYGLTRKRNFFARVRVTGV